MRRFETRERSKAGHREGPVLCLAVKIMLGIALLDSAQRQEVINLAGGLFQFNIFQVILGVD